MKNLKFLFLFAALFVAFSCSEDDEYTIENKNVTGNINYTLKSFVPLTFDSTGMNPLSAQITMEGVGTISDIGDVTMISTFTFDFVKGMGSNLSGTFTGTNAEDIIEFGGFTQQQPDGSFIATETITGGKGKFSKIKGGGSTLVNLVPDRSSGTGVISWKISY